MIVLEESVYTFRSKRPLPSSSDITASRPRPRRTLDPHTPIRTRRIRLVLPTKQRIRLIRQNTPQHHRLRARQRATLLENIVRAQRQDSPTRIIIVLDRRAVHIFLEARPADRSSTHGTRLCIGVQRQVTPCGVDFSRRHPSFSELGRAGVDG